MARLALINSASCNGLDHDIRFAMFKAGELTPSADVESAPGQADQHGPVIAPKLTVKDLKPKEPSIVESVPVIKLKVIGEKEKKKKKKPVPKWQENGLSDSDKKAIDAALSKLVGASLPYECADFRWDTGRTTSLPSQSIPKLSQSA